MRPGSTRSGENATWKSRPATSPHSSSSGAIRSRVVPGYVVDSTTTSWPDCRTPLSARVADISGPRSGSRLAVSGVGTQMSTASQRASGCAWRVASMRSATAASRSDGMSSMYDSRRRMLSILRASVSSAVTSWPASANATASGSPT